MEETDMRIAVMSIASRPSWSQTSTTIPLSITRSSRSCSLANSVLTCMRTAPVGSLDVFLKRRKIGNTFCQGTACYLLYAKQFRVAGKSQGGTCVTLLCSHVPECTDEYKILWVQKHLRS